MLKHYGLAAAFAVWACASTAMAQPLSKPSDDSRLDRLERRLLEIETQNRQDLIARDAEIARLRAIVEQKALPVPSSQPTVRPASATDKLLEEIDAATTVPRHDSVARTREEVARDAANRGAASGFFTGTRTPISFNPDIAVITDYRASVSTNNNNPARNRFDIGSVELNLRAAVDPRADAVAVIPITRDVDDPFFPSTSNTGGPETGIEIEEAYLYLHDFGVPNLTAKLGRFHLRFGRENILHIHDLPTVDNNFVGQSFLGSESLNDSGLSLSYVIPPKLIGGQYLEFVGEIISGEGNNDAGPVLNNRAFVDGPAFNGHVLWNHDVASDWNLELGGSYLTGKHNDDNRQSANLFGLDATLIHTDPTGRFNNLLIQAEGIYGIVDTSRNDTQHSKGAYLLVQQQIDRDWFLGCRLDWTQNALNERQEIWGVSPYASWYWSEFLRFRAEYQHREGVGVRAEDTLYFQVTWIFGAHPPHPYWAMR